MVSRTLFSGLLGITLFLTSCNLQDPTDSDQDNGEEPTTPAKFGDVSRSNLPNSTQPNTGKEIESADLDNDGDLDLVIATEFNPNLVLINDGSGSFSDQTSLTLLNRSGDTEDIAIADFNGDANPDLFFANQETRTNEYYLNQGNGSFVDFSNSIPVTGASHSVLSADLFNDGDQDLLIGNEGQNFLLANNGSGTWTFFPENLPSQLGITHDIVASDISGDGLLDLIVANDSDNKILVNTGNGFFESQTATRLPLIDAVEETRDVEIADLDGDGTIDIYFSNVGFQAAAEAQNRLLINNGNGVFRDSTESHLPELNTNTVAAEIEDLNGDEFPDIITGDYDGGIRVLINDGNGRFITKTGSWIPAQTAPQVQDLVVANFNNDQLPDLYICSRSGNDLLLLQRREN